jgi:peptidoglycan/xylan/chitin deacetylase (PgdA/CDA1 family)/WD40 repeat protein
MKRTWIVLLLCVTALPLWAEISFGGLEVTEEGQLLFSAESDNPVTEGFTTLLRADLEEKRLAQLTFFPEEIIYLRETGQIQIQNRFGVFRSANGERGADGFFEALPQFPSFVRGGTVSSGKTVRVGSSPDGNYLLYLRKRSAAYADLVLLNLSGDRQTVISEKVALSYDEESVSWAPDSRYFIYVKGGELYYYSLDQLQRGEVTAEEYRRIGSGSLANIAWSRDNYLYYIRNSVVYRITGAEFFARSFYRGLMDAGNVVGKVPFSFDSNFDSFYVSPDGGKILFNKGGRNLLIYFLNRDDFASTGNTKSLPYLYLPRNTRVEQLLWSRSGVISILTGSVRGGEKRNALFRLSLYDPETGEVKDRMSFEEIATDHIYAMNLSPDGETVAIATDDEVVLRRYEDWSRRSSYSHPEPRHVLWMGDRELLIAGRSYTEKIELDSDSRSVVSLSSVDRYGFGPQGEPVAQVRGRWYRYVEEEGWRRLEERVELRETGTASAGHRVYIEDTPVGNYRNMVMVRDARGYGTEQLFSYPERSYEPFPEQAQQVDFLNFTHGSRIRRREVALVFNAIDSVEGLTEILTVLKEYGIKATFFAGGEFIQRNPQAAQELADSRHEIGSLFYAHFNMTDARYRIDTQFIKEGLARNEDSYFRTTGSELSPLWHAPFYFVNSSIIRASREMNYTYVGRDVESLDWVPKTNCNDEMYKSSRELVEMILEEKQPGSIIPIRIGTVAGGREDYLFQHLDLLINGLVSRGYAVVPVTTLIEHAK